MTIPIWFKDPSILFHKDYIMEIWPSKSIDNYNQKINAIARLVILVSIIGTLVSKSGKFIIIGLITLGVLYIIYKQKESNDVKEGLEIRV